MVLKKPEIAQNEENIQSALKKTTCESHEKFNTSKRILPTIIKFSDIVCIYIKNISYSNKTPKSTS